MAGQLRSNPLRAKRRRRACLLTIVGFGLDAVALVILIDLANRPDTRIFVLTFSTRLMPIRNAPHKRGDQVRSGIGGHPCLFEAKYQRQIAVDALCLAMRRSLNALPGGCDLDEDPVLSDTEFLLGLQQTVCILDRRIPVEGQTGIDLG